MTDRVRPVVYHQGVRQKGWAYVGCGPKTGCPLDREGRLILVHSYAPPPEKVKVGGEMLPVDAEKVQVDTPRVGRGVVATTQGALL